MLKKTESLIKNTTILGFGAMCTKGIMFFLTPLITRWLSTDDYGTLDLIFTYISLLTPLITLGIGESVFRFTIDETRLKEKKQILSTALLINLIGIGSVTFLGIFYHLTYGGNINLTMACITYFIANTIYNFEMMTLRGLKKLSVYTFSNIFFVVGLAIFIPLFIYIFNFELAGILYGYACAYILSIVMMSLLARIPSYISFNDFSTLKLKKMLSYSIPVIPNYLSWWIINASDRILISIFLGINFNAIYAVANKLPSLSTTFFHVFQLSWQQSAVETLNNSNRDNYYSFVMNRTFQVVSSICIVLLSTNYWFFRFLFTEEYFSAMFQAPILVVAILFSTLSQFMGGIYVAQMKSKKNGITTVMGAILNLAINLFFIKYWGLYTVSISTLISYFAMFIVRFIEIRKDIKLQFERRALVITSFLIYFFMCSYIVSNVFQIINFIISIILILIFNYREIKKIISDGRKKLRN